MQTSSVLPVVEEWFRERSGAVAHVVIKREKIPEVIECEHKDTLVVGAETTSSSESGPAKKSKKLKKLPQKKENKSGETTVDTLEVTTTMKKNASKTSAGPTKATPVAVPQSKIEKIQQEVKKDVVDVDAKVSELTAAICTPKVINEPVDSANNGKGKEFRIGKFKCPDIRCSLEFYDAQELIDHLSEVHSLTCKLPYCTYTCFTFQDYSDHFQDVHCLANPLPAKRGPSLSMQNPRKEQKLQ